MRIHRLLPAALLLIPAIGRSMDISAESAIIMDAATGKVLWQKNADVSRYPASTTKIMTAMLLLEHCAPDDIITAPADVETVREASMHLKPGERIRAKDLFYGLMLRSANDGCYAVANHISGSVEAFSKLMNERAKQLGCTNTHFNNPNGLNDPLHTTTAHDLAIIARAAMEYEPFREGVRTWKTKINRGTNWKDLWMVNHNKLLPKDPTCDGIKTGYTVPAGHCFVGSATRDGWRTITVVLKSKHWQLDTQQMFDWSFKEFERREIAAAKTEVGTVKVTGGQLGQVAVVTERDAIAIAHRGFRSPERTLKVPAEIHAPISAGQPLGQLVLTDPDGFQTAVPVVAQSAVPATALGRIAATGTRSSNLWVPVGLIAGVCWYRGRSRRRIHNGSAPSQAS